MKKIGRLETTLLLVGILLLGSYLRFVGLGWGENQHIHPDEEFLRQVTAAVQLPERLSQYFDTANSPLSPYNRGHSFFVYGTLPLFLTRAIGEGLDRGCAGEETSPLHPARLLAPLLLDRPVEECWPGAFTGGARMIGRALAALFDLGSLVFIFLAGRRLYSSWVGLLGTLFYALAVLPIQQSHFYTVDACTNFFVAATLYLAVRAAQTNGWGAFAVGGLMTGLGMACKISVWPLGLILALAGVIRWWGGRRAQGAEVVLPEAVPGADSSGSPVPGLPGEDDPAQSLEDPPDQPGWWKTVASIGNENEHRVRLPDWAGIMAKVALAGVLAFVAFRIAQPYAFMGPGFFGLRLNPSWLDNMDEIRGLMSGAVDTFPGHQWTARPPVVFPWVNMVFWGLGLPLGLAAWAGWGWVAFDLFRAWRRSRGASESAGKIAGMAALLLWIWGTGYFLYQGTQWVKSSRYFLPIYPAFVLFAAWLVVRLVRWAWSSPRGRCARGLAVGVAVVVLGGALCWALASTSIYRRSHTRIAASRWIFENIPSAAALRLDAGGEERSVQVALQPDIVYEGGGPKSASFRLTQEGDLTGVTLNYLLDPNGDLEEEVVRVAVTTDPAGQSVLAETTVAVTTLSTGRGEPLEFPLDSVHLLSETTYYLTVQVVDGEAAQFLTSVLATEHWDWAPPLRVDGYDPYGGMYQGVELTLYFDDNTEKRETLLQRLDEVDYIITASNRLYASIPRLPTRYPLTIAYYEALFSGALGFELVADFTSPLALGPFQFPDQEEPFPISEATYQYRPASISLPLPPAAEAFSVYDHPRVLVFRKTSAYSRARAEALLPSSLLDDVLWVTPRQQTRGVREAVFDEATWEQQRAGGTWSEIFDRQGLLNRTPWLAAVVWYLAVAALGWLAFPLAFVAFPRLRDRGYGLARALGLLLVSYLAWLATSLRILPNTRGTIALMVLLLAAAGGLAAWRRWQELRGFLRTRWVTIAVSEALFLVLFAAWIWVRALNPDLWHPYRGGEKPMEFAYLNAVIKSTWFPPYDPWFAGGYLNYYYFGFVLVGALIKLLGIVPSVAYNLALSLFYALTGSAAFSVAFSLVGGNDEEVSPRPYVAGFMATLFVVVLGNLGEVRVLANGFQRLAGEPTFVSTIPGLPQLVQTLRGLVMVLRGASLPIGLDTPYWDPTRMIPGAITEFPAFTFLYADLHAHLLALPYALCGIALALNWARGGHQRQHGWVVSLLLGGLIVGSLRGINTWDYPTYLLLGLAGLALGVTAPVFAREERLSWPMVWAFLWRAVLLVALTVLLFLPYTRNYILAYNKLRVWKEDRTALDIYLLLVSQFLFPLLTLAGVEVWQTLRRDWRAAGSIKWLALAAGAVGLLLLVLAPCRLGVPVGAVVLPVVILAVGLALKDEYPVERRMVWLLLALGLALSLAVEVVVLEGDVGRMNTVFKFYLQVWTSLALGAAVAVVWLWERLRSWPVDARQVWWAAMIVLVVAMALFPIMAIPAKVKDRITQATGTTLDGMAFIQFSRTGDVRGEVDLSPDYQALVWLQENIEGSPVIMEGLGEREYLWGSRVSVYTGLPAVVGWNWHQRQQRAAAGAVEVERRIADVRECYRTTDVRRAEEILEQYGVRYVYVGPYEELYYAPEGLAKFETMADGGTLEVIYSQGGVTIYQVLQ